MCTLIILRRPQHAWPLLIWTIQETPASTATWRSSAKPERPTVLPVPGAPGNAYWPAGPMRRIEGRAQP
jgi:hypothetical protein